MKKFSWLVFLLLTSISLPGFSGGGPVDVTTTEFYRISEAAKPFVLRFNILVMVEDDEGPFREYPVDIPDDGNITLPLIETPLLDSHVVINCFDAYNRILFTDTVFVSGDDKSPPIHFVPKFQPNQQVEITLNVNGIVYEIEDQNTNDELHFTQNGNQVTISGIFDLTNPPTINIEYYNGDDEEIDLNINGFGFVQNWTPYSEIRVSMELAHEKDLRVHGIPGFIDSPMGDYIIKNFKSGWYNIEVTPYFDHKKGDWAIQDPKVEFSMYSDTFDDTNSCEGYEYRPRSLYPCVLIYLEGNVTVTVQDVIERASATGGFSLRIYPAEEEYEIPEEYNDDESDLLGDLLGGLDEE